MRHALAFGAVAFVFAVAPAAAQAGDPYAGGIESARKEQLRKDYREYLDSTKTLYFAVGCKAILVESYAGLAVANQIPGFLSRGIPKNQIDSQIRSAAREGLAKAQEGCQVWQDAPPDVIALLREMVRAGVMP